MSQKALTMLIHMRKQIFGQPAPYVQVRGAALSIGVDPIGSECEELVDELILLTNIRAADPPRLPLANHVYHLVSCKHSPRGGERAKALLGLHAPSDRAVVLLQDVVQVLDGRWRQRWRKIPSVFTAAIAAS